MNPGGLALAVGITGWALAIGLARPDAGAAVDAARAIVRPVTLPFAFAALQNATTAGDAEETFARAQQLLDQLPTWSDGHLLFAWRFALDGGEVLADPAVQAAAALRRLRIALAWLELARQRSPRHGAELLASMAFLVEMSAERNAALADLLRTGEGRPPAVIADEYLARAEAESGSHVTVKQRRLFFTPILVADLLRAGDSGRAREVVQRAITGTAALEDPAEAADWRNSLQRLDRRLAGDRSIRNEDLASDPRLLPVLPWLRSP